MGETASLSIKVTQEGASQAASALDQLARSGGQAEMSFGNLALKIAGFTSLSNLAVDAGRKTISMVTDLAKESVTLAAGFEKSRVTWGVLVGDMEKGNQVFDKLYQFAAKTPLSFEAVNQAATTIKGFGVQTQDLVTVMGKLGDVAMGDNAKLQSLALVYGQVLAQGKAKTQDLYQFINAGVPIFQLLGDSMGKSAGEIKNLAAEGAVTFDEIDKAINKATSSGGQFYDMMDKTAETMAGKWSTTVDNFKLRLASIGDTALPALKSGLESVNRLFDQMTLKNVLNGNSNDYATAITELQKQKAEWLAFKETPGNKAWTNEATNPANIAIADLDAKIDRLSRRQYQEALKGVGAQNLSGTGQGLPPVYIPPTLPTSTGTDFGMLTPAEIAGINSFSLSAIFGQPGGMGLTLDPMDEAAKRLHTYAYYTSGAYQSEINAMGNGGASSYTPMRDESSFPKPYSGVSITDLARTAQGFRAVREEQERTAKATKTFDEAMAELGSGMKELAKGAYLDTFVAIGEAWGDGADGASSFASAMADIGIQALNAMPQLLLEAGLKACIADRWGLGLTLIGASGLVAIGAGLANSSSSNSSSNTGAINTELANYYLSAESFNRQSSLLGYASGTDFAQGGWAVVGERGPELMRVPTGSQIIPNNRIKGYADGLNVPSLGMSVTVNNYAGAQVETQTETDAYGRSRLVVSILEKQVKGMASSGRLDRSLGINRTGRKVSS